MNITPRAYNGASDLARMQAFISQSTARFGDCGLCHVGDIAHGIYNNLRRFDPATCVFLWEDDHDTLLGYTILWPKQAVIEFYVAHDLWSTELPDQILKWSVANLITILREQGSTATTISAEAMDCDTQRIALYEANGFHYHEPTFMVTTRSLAEPIPDVVLPDGYTVRTAAGPHEADKLAAVHHGAFNSEWTPEQYRTLMGTPGYSADREYVVVAPDGTFGAFTVIWIDALNKTMLFEPVGTHRDYQRMGLGRAVMYHAMQRTKAEGIETAIVLHEADNPASSGLYAALGFKPKHRFSGYQKPIE